MNKLIDIINERFDYKQDGLYYKSGMRAGSVIKKYRRIMINGKSYTEHALIWLLHNNVLPTNEIDHIDRNPYNNNINNLRLATRKQNCYNKSLYKNSTTGYTGITKGYKNSFKAHIELDGKKKHLGTFYNINDALNIRREAELKYFGAYAPL
jgi:hypothetical protein